MANIVKFYANDAAKDPDAVLEQAVGKFDDVLIIGWHKNGEFDARANLGLTKEQALWLVEQFKHNILLGED